ncbi:DUF3707 domain-containing protein, partial [Haematococcus lacustris]
MDLHKVSLGGAGLGKKGKHQQGAAGCLQVEVLIGSDCQGAVAAMTLNGTALPPSYSSATSQGIRYSVLAATNLPALSSPSLAAGVRLCLTLSASSACPNLRSFCLGYDAAGGC